MNNTEESYAHLIDIPKNHKLVLIDQKVKRSGSKDNEDFFFKEVNKENEVIATYHAWSHQETYPPFKSNNGYEKTS